MDSNNESLLLKYYKVMERNSGNFHLKTMPWVACCFSNSWWNTLQDNSTYAFSQVRFVRWILMTFLTFLGPQSPSPITFSGLWSDSKYDQFAEPQIHLPVSSLFPFASFLTYFNSSSVQFFFLFAKYSRQWTPEPKSFLLSFPIVLCDTKAHTISRLLTVCSSYNQMSGYPDINSLVICGLLWWGISSELLQLTSPPGPAWVRNKWTSQLQRSVPRLHSRTNLHWFRDQGFVDALNMMLFHHFVPRQLNSAFLAFAHIWTQVHWNLALIGSMYHIY